VHVVVEGGAPLGEKAALLLMEGQRQVDVIVAGEIVVNVQQNIAEAEEISPALRVRPLQEAQVVLLYERRHRVGVAVLEARRLREHCLHAVGLARQLRQGPALIL
jgi:hypothetical protein